MRKIADLKQALLESERLDRLGKSEEAAAALGFVLQAAQKHAMTKEASPWWTKLYGLAGSLAEDLGKLKLFRRLKPYGERVLADVKGLEAGRSPYWTKRLLSSVKDKLSPMEIEELRQVMKDPSVFADANTFRSKLSPSLQSKITVADANDLISYSPNQMRNLYTNTLDANGNPDQTVMNLYEHYQNAAPISFNKTLYELFRMGKINAQQWKELDLAFASGTLPSKTMSDLQKAALAGGAMAGVTVGALSGFASPSKKPSLFPQPDPNASGPSMYPQERPSSAISPQQGPYW